MILDTRVLAERQPKRLEITAVQGSGVDRAYHGCCRRICWSWFKFHTTDVDQKRPEKGGVLARKTNLQLSLLQWETLANSGAPATLQGHKEKHEIQIFG